MKFVKQILLRVHLKISENNYCSLLLKVVVGCISIKTLAYPSILAKLNKAAELLDAHRMPDNVQWATQIFTLIRPREFRRRNIRLRTGSVYKTGT